MKKTNKHNQKKSVYEIKQNTSYFVKNRLPAFVLAGFMIFWTIASIFGIIAYCKQDKNESCLNVVGASADAVRVDWDNNLYDIPLQSVVGLTCNNIIVTDGIFVYIEDKVVYVVPNGFRSAFLSDSIDKDSFRITNFDGTIVEENSITNIIAGRNVLNIVESTIDITYWSMTPFTKYADSYNFSALDSMDISLERDEGRVSMYFTLNFGYYDSQGLLLQTIPYKFFIDFEFGLLSSGPAPLLIPLYDYSTQARSFDEIVLATDTTVSTFDKEFTFYLFNAEIWDLERALTTAELGKDLLQRQYDDLIARYDSIIEDNAGYESIIADLEKRLIEEYNAGKKLGIEIGKKAGFNEGVASANEYSFTGLLSAVFDVPIRTFTSLFDFDLLGVNLASFFFSLLTACVIIAVIRWII